MVYNGASCPPPWRGSGLRSERQRRKTCDSSPYGRPPGMAPPSSKQPLSAAQPVKQPNLPSNAGPPPLYPRINTRSPQAAVAPADRFPPLLPPCFYDLHMTLCDKAASCFTPATLRWLQDDQITLTFLPPPSPRHGAYPSVPATGSRLIVIRLAEAFERAVAMWPASVPPKDSDGPLIVLLHRIATTMSDALFRATSLYRMSNPDYVLPGFWPQYKKFSSSSSGPLEQPMSNGSPSIDEKLKCCLRDLLEDTTPELDLFTLDRWPSGKLKRY